jgi:hypothetical protein
VIPRGVEILGSECFSRCESLSSISFESNSQLTQIGSAAFSNSSLKSILIPWRVEVLGSKCFSSYSSISSVIFELNSRLTRIESEVFSSSSLQSIVIPPNIQFIDGSAFLSLKSFSISIESGNETFAIENDFLFDTVGRKLIYNISSSSNITIPAHIEVLGSECFSCCQSVSLISFESNSQLARIDRSAFSSSSLQSIVIPRSVELLCSYCFSKCDSVSSFSFESNSHLKRIESYVFYASSLQSIVIPAAVEIIETYCFSYCTSLSSITFESNSQLTQIESFALIWSSLQSITIPRSVRFIDGSAFIGMKSFSISTECGHEKFVVENVLLIDVLVYKLIRNLSNSSTVTIPNHIEILGSSCFEHCESLSSIAFDSPSQLRRSESRAFHVLDFVIVIPPTITFIATDAISNPSQISIPDCDSSPEFVRWRQLRESGINIDFRRIVRVGCGPPGLAIYGVNLSEFEEVSSQICRRQEDGILIVLKSIRLVNSVDNRVIEKEIENLLNLHHHCIITSIGFVFLGKSQELKIARLYSESPSLREIISVNPGWWTPTAKTKAIVGIVLGLRFVHSFGLIHGRLNSDNILFDLNHGIQIVDLGWIRLEKVEVDGFSDKGWIPKMDVHAFTSILFEIVIGHPPEGEPIESETVPFFVAEIIKSGLSTEPENVLSFHNIFESLKQHDFRIMENVDSPEVSAYVRTIESSEQS